MAVYSLQQNQTNYLSGLEISKVENSYYCGSNQLFNLLKRLKRYTFRRSAGREAGGGVEKVVLLYL